MRASKMIEKDNKHQIARVYEQMYRYMISKDTASLGEILSDDFVLVHMTDMKQRKDDFLMAIADGTLNYYREDTEDLIFEHLTEVEAMIIGQSRVQAAVFRGGRHTWNLQLRITLHKEEGYWKISKAVASTY